MLKPSGSLLLLAAGCLAPVPAAMALAQTPIPHVSDWPAMHSRCRPVPLVNVRAGGFLGQRIARNGPSLLKGLQSPIPRGFDARAQGKEPGPETRRLAADSDLYKWMEGAAYTVGLTKDKDLARELDRIAALVITCQQPDGYINTQVPPNSRFDPKINHDLYTAGHFFEAAVAHYYATGKPILLDAAKRWAGYLIAEYEKGNPYYGTVAQREHSEYELGFLRLARATGEKKYLDFAMTLARLIPAGPDIFSGKYAGGAHAVRVNYLLSAYADLYLETGSAEFNRHLAAIWDDIVQNRSFVTGGVSVHERYGEPHYLPQVTSHMSRDISETCTSISLMMLAWRMHSMTGESRFFDRIEAILYNHFLAGPSLDQLGTFYYNPLRMTGEPKGKTDHGTPATRRTMLPAIHTTACCIPNEWRFFGALSEYLFSYDDRGVFVNLYTSGKVRQPLPNGATAALAMETNYPHDGLITITMENERPVKFALRLRVPSWCKGATVSIEKQKPRRVEGGMYTELDREWQPGEKVTLRFEMPVRMILPDPREADNAGQAVLARGPLVYSLEQVDADFPIQNAAWDFTPAEAARRVSVEWRGNLLDGINVLKAPGLLTGGAAPGRKTLTLIPYYAHANRAEDNSWMTFLPLPAGVR